MRSTLCVIFVTAALLSGYFGLYYGTNAGISIGQQICLTNIQHSTDAALIKSVASSVSNRSGAAMVCVFLGLIFAWVSGILLGIQSAVVRYADGELRRKGTGLHGPLV